jgi:cell division protein FtsW
MTDKKLFIATSLMITIGILFSYSLSVYTVIRYDYSEFHFFIRQFITGMLSIFLMWGISQFNPDKVIKFIGLFFFWSSLTLLIILPFLPDSLATSAGGAKRWIRLPGFSLSPTEFFKIGFIYFLAWSFNRKVSYGQSLGKEVFTSIPYMLLFFAIIFLITIVQNDLGQVVLLGFTMALLFLLAGTSLRYFSILSLIAIIVFVIIIILVDNKSDRVFAWWAATQDFFLSVLPFLEPYLRVEGLPEPYQIGHSLNAIYNGGIFGNFYGNGEFKYGFLTEVHTDFVLAGIMEEFGFFGILFIVLLFLFIIYRIFSIAKRVETKEYFLFCMGIGIVISFAFIINCFGISGLTPIKGMAVPFLSYGGSSLIALSIAMGMILSISKRVKY